MTDSVLNNKTIPPVSILDWKQDMLANELIKQGILKNTDLLNVYKVGQDSAEPLSIILTRLGLVSETDIANTISNMTGIPISHKVEFPKEPPNNIQISVRYLKSIIALPVDVDSNHLTLVMAEPRDLESINAISVASGKQVIVKLGIISQINAALGAFYSEGKSSKQLTNSEIETNLVDVEQTAENIEQLLDLASEAPVIRSVNLLLQRAVEIGASDIHLEPFENGLQVRYRIDGALKQMESPVQSISAAIISRIKVMAKLDIAERRLPQDGRIQIKVLGKNVDLRVATAPTVNGESVVLRLLDRENIKLDFERLGFDEMILKEFRQLLARPHGILLVTGPTGSGKTTTLYSALNELNSIDTKIVSVEDPVEYQLHGVNQIAVNPQIGLDFANVLRSIVRQDPDVIMIGEMRDVETARIAVQSALTGHLVLSTLHTNDATGGIARLLDMGIEDYLLTTTVNGILAQRLVRVLCTECRSPYSLDLKTISSLTLDKFATNNSLTLFQANGCSHCNDTGYYGRVAILELLQLTDTIRKLIVNRADSWEINKVAIQEGMQPMFEYGMRIAAKGVTSLEEVLRVTREV